MCPDVVDVYGSVLRQFALNPGRPGLNVRIKRVVGLDHGKERQCAHWERPQRRVALEHVVCKLRRGRICRRVDSITNCVRVDVARVVDLAALGGIKEDSVAAAEDRLWR